MVSFVARGRGGVYSGITIDYERYFRKSVLIVLNRFHLRTFIISKNFFFFFLSFFLSPPPSLSLSLPPRGSCGEGRVEGRVSLSV